MMFPSQFVFQKTMTVQDDKNQDIEILLIQQSKNITDITNTITNKISDPYRLLFNVEESMEENLIIRCSSQLNHGEPKCNCPFLIVIYDHDADTFELWKELGFTKLIKSTGVSIRKFEHAKLNIIEELDNCGLQQKNMDCIPCDNDFFKNLKIKGYDLEILRKYCGAEYGNLLKNKEFLKCFELKIDQEIKNTFRGENSYQEILEKWGILDGSENESWQADEGNEASKMFYRNIQHHDNKYLVFGFKVTKFNKNHFIELVHFDVFEKQEYFKTLLENGKDHFFGKKWLQYIKTLEIKNKYTAYKKTIGEVIIDVGCNFVNKNTFYKKFLSVFEFICLKQIKLMINCIWNEMIVQENKRSIQFFLQEYATFYHKDLKLRENLEFQQIKNSKLESNISSFDDTKNEILYGHKL